VVKFRQRVSGAGYISKTNKLSIFIILHGVYKIYDGSGNDDPYEEPVAPELALFVAKKTPDILADEVIAPLKGKGIISQSLLRSFVLRFSIMERHGPGCRPGTIHCSSLRSAKLWLL